MKWTVKFETIYEVGHKFILIRETIRQNINFVAAKRLTTGTTVSHVSVAAIHEIDGVGCHVTCSSKS